MLLNMKNELGSFTDTAQATQVVLVVKNLPANAEIQETWAQSLGQEDQEDPLEDEMTRHSSIFA